MAKTASPRALHVGYCIVPPVGERVSSPLRLSTPVDGDIDVATGQDVGMCEGRFYVSECHSLPLLSKTHGC